MGHFKITVGDSEAVGGLRSSEPARRSHGTSPVSDLRPKASPRLPGRVRSPCIVSRPVQTPLFISLSSHSYLHVYLIYTCVPAAFACERAGTRLFD